MDSPGFKRLTKDRKKYEALVEDTLRRQREAMEEAKGKPDPSLKPRNRAAGRKDTDYPKGGK